MRRLLLVCVLAAGCHHEAATPPTGTPATPPDPCTASIGHFFSLAEASGQIGLKERLLMSIVKPKMIEACQKEGMTQAQAACFLAVKTNEDMQKLDSCPALKERPLRWISMTTKKDPHDAPAAKPAPAPATH